MLPKLAKWPHSQKSPAKQRKSASEEARSAYFRLASVKIAFGVAEGTRTLNILIHS
jgi:hypothetical protein